MEQQQANKQMPHSRYKTSLCHHWTQSQTCARGDSCHFAHGDSELREASQNQPVEAKQSLSSFQYLQTNWNSGQPHNYKSVLCKNFEKGSCKFGENCNYAHGKDELQKPDSQQSNQIQMQAIQGQIQLQMMQYNMMNAQNMMVISQQLTAQMKELSKLDKCDTIKAGIQQATTFYQQGNLLQCQNILNNCIFNDNHALDEDQKEQLTKIQDLATQQQKQNKIQGQSMPMMPTVNMNVLMGMGMSMGMGGANQAYMLRK